MEQVDWKKLPQGGTDPTVGESPRATARRCPSYSGEGTNRFSLLENECTGDRELPDSGGEEERRQERRCLGEDMSSSRQSLMSPSLLESDMTNELLPARRKRNLSGGSDVAPKISTARRGRQVCSAVPSTSSGTVRTSKDFLKPDVTTYCDESPQSQSTKNKSGRKTYAHLDSDVLIADDLWKRALEEVGVIQEQSRKCKNMKGTVKSAINQSLVTMRDIIDGLKSRNVDDETRRLRLDNERLSRELANLRTELGALRRDYEERNIRDKAPPPPPPPSSGMDMEEIIRRVTISVGEMVNARLAGIDDRLLPAISLRPPLAADKKKVPIPSGHPVRTTAVSALPTGPSVEPMGRRATVPYVPGVDADSSRARASSIDKRESWATVSKRGRKKKAAASAAPVPVASARPTTKKTGVPMVPPRLKRKKPKFGIPRSAAVIITLSPEAQEKGTTYAEVMSRAKASINLGELDIEGVRSRVTATGARMMELTGAASSTKADLLADKLRLALADSVRVVRPVKCVDLRITGLDDSAGKDEIAAVIATKGGCPLDSIKVSDIKPGPGGSGVALVQCPATAAKVVTERGRLLVGWSSARVSVLESRPMRCFRCMAIGHTRQLCPSEKDRGELCFRCGKDGHKATACKVPEPRCDVCVDAKRPACHRMGGRRCNPPTVKGKPAPRPQFAAANETTDGRDEEVVVMSD